jgi:uncharacterized phage protein (TIGR01671 family)
MRVIKFKAFHKIRKELYQVYGWHSEFVFKDTLDGVGNDGNPDKLEDVELMQFTGLTDKNGVNIYDGDILKVDTKHGFNSDLLMEFKLLNNLDTINGIGLHFTGIVRIDLLRGLMFENIENGYQEPMFTRHIEIKQNHSSIEVIGNIHSNPKLLC